MRRDRGCILFSLVLVVALVVPGCPSSNSNAGTFPFYIANFSTYSLTSLKMNSAATNEKTELLTSAVPANTLKVIRLDTANFGESFGVVEYKLSDDTGDEINSRVDNDPGNLGFRIEEVGANRAAGLCLVDDDSKRLDTVALASLTGQP